MAELVLRAAIEAETAIGVPRADESRPPAILIPLKLRRAGVALDLFTTITTVGTPLDITLAELWIETLFPATADARIALENLIASDDDS